MTKAQDTLKYAEDRLAQRDLPAAIAAFERAEFAGASADACAGGRWMAHMLAGNFAAAWSESDAIRRRGAPDPHRFWAGEDLRGRRVILRCLHGYGDTVQFLRYAPRLSELAAHLVVEAPPVMVEIACCFDGVNDVITWDTEARGIRNWDVQVEIMELPYLFRTEADELPLAERYLHLPAAVESRVARAMGCSPSPRVGLVWAAGDWNIDRSIPFDLLRPLLGCSDCEFWNLQGGLARAEWKRKEHLRDAAECGEGILTLAATIAQLDLVITVDTLAAHLAGAMGKPAWLLLQYAADWRWMTRRSDSPWYPSLRLFRQPAPGAWESTVHGVAQELTRWRATVPLGSRLCPG
jgi:hypothetical protein